MMPPLRLAGAGMASALGIGASLNAAAMRCGYNGFVMADNLERDNENLIMAKAPLDAHLRGNQRLFLLLCRAIEEALIPLPANESLAVIACLGEGQSAEQDQRLLEELLAQLNTGPWGTQIDDEQLFGYCRGRVSFAYAAQSVRELWENSHYRYALVIAVDSLLSPRLINRYQSFNRLLTDDNTDGFVPGEAAVALLLTQESIPATTEILGIGFGEETGTIHGDKPLTGQGLTQAVEQCTEASGLSASDTDFRLSSASGETYFFKEMSIVHGRTVTQRKAAHPLWHPADHIGEVGTVTAPAMIIMAHYAFQKGYAPGHTALCHISNDDARRAALLLRYVEKTS